MGNPRPDVGCLSERDGRAKEGRNGSGGRVEQRRRKSGIEASEAAAAAAERAHSQVEMVVHARSRETKSGRAAPSGVVFSPVSVYILYQGEEELACKCLQACEKKI